VRASGACNGCDKYTYALTGPCVSTADSSPAEDATTLAAVASNVEELLKRSPPKGARAKGGGGSPRKTEPGANLMRFCVTPLTPLMCPCAAESILKGKGGITFDAKARGPATNISYMDIVKSRQKQ
jgi:hypothetical protein